MSGWVRPTTCEECGGPIITSYSENGAHVAPHVCGAHELFVLDWLDSLGPGEPGTISGILE